jgi:hypothetical protein
LQRSFTGRSWLAQQMARRGSSRGETALLLTSVYCMTIAGAPSVSHYDLSRDEPHSSGFGIPNATGAAGFLGLLPPQDTVRFGDVIKLASSYPPPIEPSHNGASYIWCGTHSPQRSTAALLKACSQQITHFKVRHHVTFLLSLMGYVALWAPAHQLGLRGFWVLTPLLLWASAPTHWGHSHFNSKDSGFAVVLAVGMWAVSSAMPTLLGREKERRRDGSILGVTTGLPREGRLGGALILAFAGFGELAARPRALSMRELLKQVPSAGTRRAAVRVSIAVAAARVMAPPNSSWCARPRPRRTSRTAASAGDCIGAGWPQRNCSPPPRVKASLSVS